MKKSGLVVVSLMAIIAVAMISYRATRSNALDASSTQVPENNAPFTQNEIDQNNPIAVPSRVSRSSAPARGPVHDAWRAKTAGKAIELAAAVNKPWIVADLATMIRATCVSAEKVSNLAPTQVAQTSDEELADIAAKRVYWKSYCADFREIAARIQPLIENLDEDAVASDNRVVGELISAAEHSNTAAEALIDEVVNANAPSRAIAQAYMLSSLVAPDRTLANWQRFLPPRISMEERLTFFGLVGEIVACQNFAASCAANMPMAIFNCRDRCRAGEGVIDHRRRTTAPIIFEGAQRMAWEMLSRRSR